jgi:hypothetical protein
MLCIAESDVGSETHPKFTTPQDHSRYVNMQDNESDSVTPKMVAPGYPAIDTIKQIDVTGWEPAAVFTPVDDPKTGSAEEAESE